MKICVYGLWHLGSVTAACLASKGHFVLGLDDNLKNIKNLKKGLAPIFEPGLDEIIKEGIKNGLLSFSHNHSEALKDCDLLWITFDTPLDEEDNADSEFVLDQIKKISSKLKDGTILLVSSQIPLGTIKKLENFVKCNFNQKQIFFAYSPENLRLGQSIETFLKPERIVVGIRSEKTKKKLEPLFKSITSKIEWMGVESAEMTKHAINSFLATSVTFANEIASICEFYGADAKEVERGLKTEKRIGPLAYLSPGGPFAGGTLARDVEFLNRIANGKNFKVPLLSSIRKSNNEHKKWILRKICERFTNLQNISVAIWGLTYKPETSTIRNSLSIEICKWLISKGAKVKVYDPVVKTLPKPLNEKILISETALKAIIETNVLIIGTEWPEFRLSAKDILGLVKKNYLVIDANRFLEDIIDSMGLDYLAVGMPKKFDKK